jgi:hypothetical protein
MMKVTVLSPSKETVDAEDFIPDAVLIEGGPRRRPGPSWRPCRLRSAARMAQAVAHGADALERR